METFFKYLLFVLFIVSLYLFVFKALLPIAKLFINDLKEYYGKKTKDQ